MKVVFDHNISLKFLNQEAAKVSDTIQKLSSGLEINKAADNPSNLAILTTLRARIGGIEASIQNVQDAISLYQTQDTGLSNCELKLVQMKELAVKASNEAVLRDDCLDRTRMNEEVQNLKNAIQDIAINTTFNTKQVLIGDPLETLEAVNSDPITNGELGVNPSWDSDSKTVYYESERAKGSRTVADDNDIYRIWSVTDDATKRIMVTPDPYTPADRDNDGFVKHPLSDRNDKDPNIPAGGGGDPTADSDGDGIVDFFDDYPGFDQVNPPDTDGDGEIDLYDPYPNDGAQTSMVYNDADGDGWPDDLDADPGDPANPGAPPADYDGDGAPDMFDPFKYNALYNAANPRDNDGDGIINYYDTYGTVDVFNVVDNDGDGYPGIPTYDPDDNDPAIPFLGTDDADGDGWPTYLDGGPGDPTGTGDDSNKYLPLTAYSYEDRSPDFGTRGLLFASNRNTPYTSDADPWVSDIFLMDGNKIVALTNDPEIDENPVWLDDGRYIAWLRDGDLVYMPMEECQTTNSIVTIASDAGGIENPVWQPNTTNIFYNKGQDIFYAGLDSVEYQLSGTLEDGSTGIIQGEDMTFSPEGEFLWYHRGGQNYYFDMAKQEEHLFNGIGDALNGDWSPDGDKITFERAGKIYSANLDYTYETESIQVGPDGNLNNRMDVNFADARVGSLGIGNISVANQDAAMKAIDIASEGLERLNTMRNIIGIEVRNLWHIADELNQERINLMAAASTIGDADFADQLTALAKSNILQDSALSTAAVTPNINLETTQNLVNDRLHTDLHSGYTKYRAGMY